MPRRQPTSTRQKKEERQLKRAVKRGDVSPPPPKQKKAPKKRLRVHHGNAPASSSASVESSRKLQSFFIKSSTQFLEDTKALASTVLLSRPIHPSAAILPGSYEQSSEYESLVCPRRPKWRYDMSKKEVESNEEGLFKKWLQETDSALEKWRLGDRHSDDHDDAANLGQEQAQSVLRSTPSFERNLEVWRQLWRVTEISQIILVLVDSRCPLLHYPPSLARYLSNRKVILVLTKVDITGPTRVSAWIDYLRNAFPSLRVVQVQSYTAKEAGFHHQGRTKYDFRIPQIFRQQLLNAIRELHTEMLQPPEKIVGDPEKLKHWKPPVKQDIDWSAALDLHAQHNLADYPSEEDRFLTIGLLGSPNVGKSSLLNALIGEPKVRASKTPGKTKHFQTLFWTPEIRLADCPGLVMPHYVPMEMQVLSGVLPISRVSAIPACVQYAAQLLPLEFVFNLSHPRPEEPLMVDKRTWREGTKRIEHVSVSWTAMDILVAFANKKSWVTAKAGRPDFSRAGNASKVLRALAEGQIPWGFWPPGTPLSNIRSGTDELSCGTWIQSDDQALQVSDEEDSEVSGSNSSSSLATDSGDDSNEDLSLSEPGEIGQTHDESYRPALNTTTRFAVLQLDEDIGDGDE
ncbi:GTPase [Lentinula guzmanii]|uniref:Guanine nucleotide-binding protein-like 1 n=1 Tax=Lentinula guzmanii TaxID=2804957 RepID=A0AA38J7N4_9AGAR|nr:GTPase [Lentinula guzmanii]